MNSDLFIQGCKKQPYKLTISLMRFIVTGSFFRPVAVIVSLQASVLLGALTISGTLNPALSALESLDSPAPAGRSLFPVREIVDGLDEESEAGQNLVHEQNLERDISYTVARGDTVSAVWLKNGAPALGAVAATTAIKDAGVSKFTIKRGENLSLRIARDGDIVGFAKKLDDGSTLVLRGNSTSGYEASVIKPNIEERERVVVGTILTSFSASAGQLGIGPKIVDDIVDLFGDRVEFSKAIQPGDSFTVTYIEKRCKDTGEVLDSGPVIKASILQGEKLFAAIRYKATNGEFLYYNEKGEKPGNYFLRYPVQFTRISSTFSWARFHPVLQRTRPHYGVDFSAPVGTPVRAVGDGIVKSMGFKSEPGNVVQIQHNDRWATVYMHLNGFAKGLRAGQRVSRGEIIGYVGATGLATGPHLHFGLFDQGKYVDPLAANLPNISINDQRLPNGYLQAALQDIQKKHDLISVASLLTARLQG